MGRPDQSLRQRLDRMVQTKEAWAAALTGGIVPLFDNAPAEARTPAAMLARLEKADGGVPRRARTMSAIGAPGRTRFSMRYASRRRLSPSAARLRTSSPSMRIGGWLPSMCCGDWG